MEVIFCSVNTGQFVNRGFLNGPVCPIYGFGALAMIALLTPIQNNLLLLYLGSALVASLLELVAGFILKHLFHTSWWDYSDQPFNIGGYISLKFSLLWGLAGVGLMRFIHPVLAGITSFVPFWLGVVLLCVLYTLLLADCIVTVAGILKLNRALGEITKVAQGLHKSSEAMAKNIGNRAIATAQKVEELDIEGKRQELTQKWEDSKQKREQSAQERREKLAAAFSSDALRAKWDEIFSGRTKVRNRLLRAFPNMKSKQYNQALQELKKRFTDGRKGKTNPDDPQK